MAADSGGYRCKQTQLVVKQMLLINENFSQVTMLGEVERYCLVYAKALSSMLIRNTGLGWNVLVSCLLLEKVLGS